MKFIKYVCVSGSSRDVVSVRGSLVRVCGLYVCRRWRWRWHHVHRRARSEYHVPYDWTLRRAGSQ